MATRKAPAAGRARPAPSDKVVSLAPGKSVLDVKSLREKYGLNRPTFARLIGATEADLERLEAGTAPADPGQVTRVQRVAAILKKASSAMRLAYLPTWVERPSPACAELGARAPIDLMERGDYDEVEALLFDLGSGVPS